MQTLELKQQLRDEVNLMLSLTRDSDHPGIVRTIAATSQKTRGDGGVEAIVFRVVMELCPGGSLLNRVNEAIRTTSIIPDHEVWRYTAEIASALCLLHGRDMPLAHRDIKLENVLMAADGALRLCDFGSVNTHQGPVTDRGDRAEQENLIERFTTPHFRSPEMIDLYSGSLTLQTPLFHSRSELSVSLSKLREDGVLAVLCDVCRYGAG